MTIAFKISVAVAIAVIILSIISIVVLSEVKPLSVKPREKSGDTKIRIAVLNGCGREGLAALCAKKLRNEGFDVVNGMGGNADSFDFDVSVVVDRKGDYEKARTIGEVMGISDILDQRSDNPYLIENVVVILGRDWDTLKLFNKEDED